MGRPPRKFRWLRWLAIIFFAFVVTELLLQLWFPFGMPGSRYKNQAKRETVKSMARQITAALIAYHVEYGRWPVSKMPGKQSDEFFVDDVSNALLFRVLSGKEDMQNAGRIAFFEGSLARKDGFFKPYLRNGFDPQTGALLDPWGHAYRIALDSNEDGAMANPYPDDGKPWIRSGVLVWSLGKDGVQGAKTNPLTLQGSDDILSWD